MTRINKTNTAWDFLFEKYNILESINTKKYFTITSNQINEVREARLMAKFDTFESLPIIFRKNKLNINAITNGEYIIFHDLDHKSFIQLPDYSVLVPEQYFPRFDFKLDTLKFRPDMSESNAIDFAYHSGLLYQYFDVSDLKLTTRGRLFSNEFDLILSENIDRFKVKGVQIEIDAGYEGEKQFIIIEAKNSTRKNFNIRQLFYPLQHFKNKTNKHIRTVLISFSNGIYYFTEIKFNLKYYDYHILSNKALGIIITEKKIKTKINELLGQETYTPPNIPIPQADDLNKVIDTTTYLLSNPSDKFCIAEYFEFDERQGDYYGNAAVFIGLAERKHGIFKLSNLGEKIIQIQNRDERNEELTKAILKTKIFNDLVGVYIKQGEKISDEQIINRIMEEGYNETTSNRRKSTIKSWLKWISLNFINI
ncbi:MAG: hypothetical protein H8D45_07075 [Bacteroidetes bacterium]|nr:hypothetical protein [Bacteroidota bacterium]MBL7103981.1 hypothetical protein [Bacteroidales bacterium]